MPKLSGFQSWLTALDKTGRYAVPPHSGNGIRAYRQLPRSDQLVLVRELVDVRKAEFCRTFRNLVDVTLGYKEKRTGDTRRIIRTLCVVFLVRKKWPDVDPGSPNQRLPTHMFVHATIGGERKLLGVPTDVVSVAKYKDIAPDSPHGGAYVDPGDEGGVGVGAIACVIQRVAGPAGLWALSCRHFFSMSEEFHPKTIWNSPVLARDGQWLGPQAAVTRVVAGKLEDSRLGSDGRIQSWSFDAQLAEVTDRGALRQALTSRAPLHYVGAYDEIPDSYTILTPRGSVRADLMRAVTNIYIDYRRPGVRNVVHQQLIESSVRSPTMEGDSGSPVVHQATGRLIGMHIAGNKVDTALCIPAWQLMRPANYPLASADERWKLVDP